MRIEMTKEIDWEYIGALLAQSDDTEQAKFFKTFVKECNSWGTRHQVEMQLAGVNQGLTDDEKETLSMLGYKEKTP